MAAKKTYKFPKTMGACADRLYLLKTKRAEAQRVADELKAEESALKEHVIETLPKSEASGVAGKVARVTVINKEVPQVSNWDLLYKHIKKTGQFELLGRRLSATAINERWEAGKEVPGVGHFKATTISLNKI